MNHLTTQRLLLRPWRESDRLLFSRMNADPMVMRYFPNELTKLESDSLVDRLAANVDAKGWGFWAAEVQAAQQFIGFIGLNEPSSALPCSPCVEIGWRLARQFWGQGYATEGAQASLKYAFDVLDLEQVVSFTPTSNKPSIAVMKRAGLTNMGRNFLHPALPLEHPLAEHVLYGLNQSAWQALAQVG